MAAEPNQRFSPAHPLLCSLNRTHEPILGWPEQAIHIYLPLLHRILGRGFPLICPFYLYDNWRCKLEQLIPSPILWGKGPELKPRPFTRSKRLSYRHVVAVLKYQMITRLKLEDWNWILSGVCEVSIDYNHWRQPSRVLITCAICM